MPLPNLFAHCLAGLLLVALVAACGDPEPAPGQDEGGVDAAEVAPGVDVSDTRSEGEGTLRLGDATYEFHVRACDLSGETDDMYQTISGRGTTADGEQFDVFVSRNEVGDILTHTVSLQKGDVRRGLGTVIEAQRMRSAGSWMSMLGGPSEPLIRIDGNRVVAEGRFADERAPDEVIDGRLEATCR